MATAAATWSPPRPARSQSRKWTIGPAETGAGKDGRRGHPPQPRDRRRARRAQPAAPSAYPEGVRYFDTAEGYKNSERVIGNG